MSERNGSLPVRYAGVPYLDRTRALQSGAIVPDGVDLEYVAFDDVAELFRRMAQESDFDASEMSLSTYVMLHARGDRRMVAIPVFPSRAFRHSQIYVSAKSGIREPADLVGKNVGVPAYQMTAALWIRALLEHEYGVRPGDLHWWTGGLIEPGYHERSHHEVPEGVTLDVIPEDRALEEMLAAGDLDALVTAASPEPYRDGSGRVARLFPDYRPVELDYYRRTGLFPIMHTVVINRELYEANRWLALSLLNAFEAAKREARIRLRDLDTLAVMHPWLADELERQDAEFGGDPFAYGIEPNRAVLEATVRYSVEQHLATKPVDVDELFAEETRAWSPRALEEPVA